VAPSDFEDHRMSYDVLGPCCLCPFQHRDIGDFKESVIFMAGYGRYVGEYVAACADGRCDYFGSVKFVWLRSPRTDKHLVFMERFHARRGTLIRRYPIRGQQSQSVM
jgi:hypothetical protein